MPAQGGEHHNRITCEVIGFRPTERLACLLPALRRQILEDGWTAEATYTDPLAKAVGHEQISALIGNVQQRFPGFTFELIKGPDGYGDHLRFGWSLGPDSAERLIEGSDVVTTRGGRITSVIGFLDRVPPQA